MKLKTYLLESGLTEAEMARQIGVSQTAVNRYASGRRIPRPSVVARIEIFTKNQVTASDFVAEYLSTKAPSNLEVFSNGLISELVP